MVQEPYLDALGNPMLDHDGNPIYPKGMFIKMCWSCLAIYNYAENHGMSKCPYCGHYDYNKIM